MNDGGKILVGIVIGISVGAFTALLAFMMSGAGHGWGSGCESIPSIFAAPIAGLAWGLKNSYARLHCSIVAICGAIYLDYMVISNSIAEGTEYIYKVLPFALVWAIFFFSWQILALVVFATSLWQNFKRPNNIHFK